MEQNQTPAERFWNERADYHDLAKRFEDGLTITAPDHYECELGIGGHCPYCRTNVKYMEYRGEAV